MYLNMRAGTVLPRSQGAIDMVVLLLWWLYEARMGGGLCFTVVDFEVRVLRDGGA